MDGIGLSASLLQPLTEETNITDNSSVGVVQNSHNLLEDEMFLKADGEIPVLFGKRDDEKVIIHDLHDIPHMLVCGFTGTGKTSFVKSILATIVTNIPSEKVGFVIFDSKQVEYLSFQSVPNMIIPIVTDEDKVSSVINFYAQETRSRLQNFASCGRKELSGYNFYCERMGKKGLPEVFIVLDDFATIKADKDTILTLNEILRNGRITGIHLIIVSSVTSSKVLQKELLSNIPCRISFCLASRAESRVVLEDGGAESLFVPGEMIVKYQGNTERCQCAHATDENIATVLRQVQIANTSNLTSLGNAVSNVFAGKSRATNNNNAFDDTRDEYFVQAGNIIIDKEKASIGMLQRVFKIGFNRAARIMDQLCEFGVVGDEEGTAPRKILMTKEEFDYAVQNPGAPRHQQKHEPPRSISASNSLRNDNANNPYMGVQKNNEDNTEEERFPKVPLRDFPDVEVGECTIGIRDNLIKYSVPIMTRLGRGTATPAFAGSMVERIVYKKPTELQKGFLTFAFFADVTISNPNPELFVFTKDNISDVIKIEFGTEDARIMWLIAKQISEDIQVPITVL